jgi:hypothetical protein
MSSQLKTAENEEYYKVSYVNAGCCWVGAQVESDGLLQSFTELLFIGGLRDKPAPLKVIN